MRGNLSDKLFPGIVRDLAKENATGRLRLTQIGKIREILIESGVPVFASSTLPEEQPEFKLVQEGLITPEQLDAAVLTARQAAQPVEKILVQTKAITRLVLQRILCELSTAVINSSSEWISGDYRFVAAPKVPLEAKLIWSATECILTGARYASANNAVLDSLAADNRTVKPVCDSGSSGASSATLSSTEGYVLSCIQSPTTIAEASMLTGLSHIDTRRAILVLIMLGLLEAQESAANRAGATRESRPATPPPQLFPAARQAVLRSAQAEPTTRPALSSEPAATSAAKITPASAAASDTLAAGRETGVGKAAGNPAATREPDAWPLDLESSNYGGLDDDSSQIDFNSSDISFIDFPEQAASPQKLDHRGTAPPHSGAVTEGVNLSRKAAPVGGTAASEAVTAPPAREGVGSVFIPGAVAPPRRENGRNGGTPDRHAGQRSGSVYLPGSAAAAPQEPDGEPVSTPAAGSARERTGSISLPASAASPVQGQVNSSPAPSSPVEPVRQKTGSIFIPGRTPQPASGTVSSSPAISIPAAPMRGNTGSIFIPGRTPPSAPGPVSSSPATSSPAAPIRERPGSVLIPSRTPPPAPEGPNSSLAEPLPTSPEAGTGPVFTPGAAAQAPKESATSEFVPAPRVAPFRANTGSVYIPGDAALSRRDPAPSPPLAATHSAPLREYPESSNGSGASPERYTAPPAVPQASSANSDLGYGWNGQSDPRLHQEWRDQVAAPASQDNADDERFLKRVIEELGAKIRIAASADYYQILGIDKLASNGSITKAYERITRINDSHKSRWPYNAELQSQISSLMVVVSKAYETLGNPERRRVYDMPPKQQAPAIEIERGSGPTTGSTSARTVAPPPPRPSLTPAPSGGLIGPAPESTNPYQAAEELYRRGRAAFARSDLQAAAHLLRQAVNLDPNRSTYHYQLGMTLFILSQARAEHKHDKGCHVTCKMGGNLTRNQRIRHEAEQHLLKASELEPSNSDIKLKLALLYKDAHMDRKAHQYFYEALMLDPNCHIARVELGMEDSSKKENDEDQWIKDLMRDRMKKK